MAGPDLVTPRPKNAAAEASSQFDARMKSLYHSMDWGAQMPTYECFREGMNSYLNAQIGKGGKIPYYSYDLRKPSECSASRDFLALADLDKGFFWVVKFAEAKPPTVVFSETMGQGKKKAQNAAFVNRIGSGATPFDLLVMNVKYRNIKSNSVLGDKPAIFVYGTNENNSAACLRGVKMHPAKNTEGCFGVKSTLEVRDYLRKSGAEWVMLYSYSGKNSKPSGLAKDPSWQNNASEWLNFASTYLQQDIQQAFWAHAILKKSSPPKDA